MIERDTLVVSGHLGVDSDPGEYGGLRLGRGVVMDDAAGFVVSDRVSLDRDATVANIAVNDEAHILGTVAGDWVTPLVLPWTPSRPTPADLDVSVEEDLVVPPGAVVALPPGLYGNATVGAGARVHLDGGVYRVGTLSVESGASLVPEGPTVMVVDGDAEIRDEATLGGRNGPHTLLTMHATDLAQEWRLGDGVEIAATVVAPTATIVAGRRFVLTGSVYAQAVSIARRGILEYVPADPAVVTPKLEVVEPMSDELLFDIAQMRVALDPGDAAEIVRAYVYGEPVAEAPPLDGVVEFAWDTTAFDDGDYVIEFFAYGPSGSVVAATSVTVIVHNAMDSVSRVMLDWERGAIPVDAYVQLLTLAPDLQNRLPDRYRSDAETSPDTVAGLEVWAHIADASAEVQDLVAAYDLAQRNLLLPNLLADPDLDPRTVIDPLDDTWLDVGDRQQASNSQERASDICFHIELPGDDGPWNRCYYNDDEAMPHFEIRYALLPREGGLEPPDPPASRPKEIDELAEVLEESWRYYRQLGYAAPPANANGGKIRVIVGTSGNKARRSWAGPFTGNDIYLRTNGYSDGIVRHEVFHHFQFGYFRSQWLHEGTPWMVEATAQWAAHHASVAANDHHYTQYAARLPEFLGKPSEDLTAGGRMAGHAERRAYGAFILFEYLSQRFGVDIVRHLWERVDDGVGGLDALWEHEYGSATLSPFSSVLTNFWIAAYRLSPDGPTPWRFDDPHLPEWVESLKDDPATQDLATGHHRPQRTTLSLTPAEPQSVTQHATGGGSHFIDLISSTGTLGPSNVELQIEMTGDARMVLVPFGVYPSLCSTTTDVHTNGEVNYITLPSECRSATLTLVSQDRQAAADADVVVRWIPTHEGALIDLGVLEGWDETEANAVSSSGYVAGTASRVGDPLARAFIWSMVDGMRPVTCPAAIANTWGEAVNDRGQVAGRWRSTHDAVPGLFLWDAEVGCRDLGVPSGWYPEIVTMNNGGQIVGTMKASLFSNDRAFLWDPIQGFTMLDPEEGRVSRPTDINESGAVVGRSVGAGGGGFIWDAVNGFRLLPTWRAGFGLTFPNAINEAGQVAGGLVDFFSDVPPAVRWESDLSITPMPRLMTSAIAINSTGAVAGTTDSSTATEPMLLFWDSSGLEQIRAIDPGQGYVPRIAGLTDEGEVAGEINSLSYYWSRSTGPVEIGNLPGHEYNDLVGISEGGMVVGNTWPAERAFAWFPEGE